MEFSDLTIFLLPAYFVFVGFISHMIKDKPIDKKYGYRSSLSTKNKHNWYYANNFMAKGAFALAIFFIGLGLILSKNVTMYTYRKVIFILIEFISYIALGIILENRLKSVHRR